MARIIEDNIFTQVVQFLVEPDRQAALIAAITTEVERCVRHRPGFVASSFHASLDGRHVLNYAQRCTKADFEAFTRDPEGERLGAAVRAAKPLAGPEAVRYRVARVIEAAPSSP
jgi:hypothetical protein